MPKKDKKDPSKLRKCPQEIRDKIANNDEVTMAKQSKGKLRYKNAQGGKIADVDVEDVLDPGSDLFNYYMQD